MPTSDHSSTISADAQSGRRNFIKTALATAGGSFALQPTLASAAPATAGNRIVDLTGVELAQAIRARQVSCREVMQAYLKQIDACNPKVNAIVTRQEPEQLLRQADERDRELGAGQWHGWMHGFPQAPKDLADTAGIVTTSGSPLFKDRVPEVDGIIVERVRRAGAILIGKTNTPSFGLGSHTYNKVFGTTLNAYDQRKSAGGSSGGAAVALALRMLPVADGSDMMGSLRNPAAFNNVYGFRPSYGRVPFGPKNEVFYQQLGYEGPMARNVTDLAMLLSVQAGFDDRVPLSMQTDTSTFLQPLKRDFKGKRIGWLGNFNGYLSMEAGVLAQCEQALRHFDTIGAKVEPARPDFAMERVWKTWLTLRGFLVAGAAAPLYENPQLRALLKPETIWEIEHGLKFSAMDVYRASTERSAWYQAMRKLFETYDYLVLPSAQVYPFDATIDWPKQIAGKTMDTYHRWMEVVTPATLASLPVINVPVGFNRDGLPMGMQIIGKAQADLSVLQIAYAYEQASDYGKRRPALLDQLG